MQLKNNLGKRIQNIRKQKKMTQEKLAEIIGIDSKNVSKIENGINYPSAETLSAISKALDVEIYELFLFKRELPYNEMKKEIIKELDNRSSIIKLYKIVSELRNIKE